MSRRRKSAPPEAPDTTIPLKIIRQNRRSMMMRALPGIIEVYIPSQFSRTDSRVRDFITQGLQKLDGKVPQIPPEQTPRAAIEALVSLYAARMSVIPARLQFREMLRKWGSCSSTGTVTLNTRLTWLPAELVEYIVCHELAHLIELNHSKRFWAVVGQHMPDYRERLHRLRETERTLW